MTGVVVNTRFILVAVLSWWFLMMDPKGKIVWVGPYESDAICKVNRDIDAKLKAHPGLVAGFRHKPLLPGSWRLMTDCFEGADQ